LRLKSVTHGWYGLQAFASSQCCNCATECAT
jgi:hypothetical protein